MVGPTSSWRRGALAATVLAAGCLIALTSPVAATSARACTPTIQDLGAPFGGHFSLAEGINAAGTVAGSAVLPSGRTRAVVWRDGTATSLGVLPPYDASFAHGINDNGIVVGELDLRQRETAPFIYVNGTMRKLPGLGGTFAYASAINNRGVIVGVASDADGQQHAVSWTDGGTLVHDLGFAPGDASSAASGINDANVVVGNTNAPNDGPRPAVFAHHGVVALPARDPQGYAEDVNLAGRIVGTIFAPRDEGHAMTWGPWRPRGRDLGTLPGGTTATLLAIDNAGTAVGTGDLAGARYQNHAILWPGFGPLLMLRPLSGHQLHGFAVAISLGSGGDAVGGSQSRSGDVHATVWTCAAQQAFLPTGRSRGTSTQAPAVTLPPGMVRSPGL